MLLAFPFLSLLLATLIYVLTQNTTHVPQASLINAIHRACLWY
jgi:hypothetical protein